ncbi:MAG: hypothetical protein LCI00_28795 [Chloroflexi bacterium]|nr:hypothetical protein [Chloroflexota bacterium]MCC6891546.1 PD40 domain-containing protein [Anaerolineae bacterium]
MPRLHLLPLWFLGVWLIGTINLTMGMTQPAAAYRYAYNVRSAGANTLHLIDPAVPDAPVDTLTVPANAAENPYIWNMSPDGRWILAAVETQKGSVLRLYTPDAKAQADFLPHAILGGVRWSPDSQWLVMLAISSEEASSVPFGHYHAYLYHLESATLYPLDANTQRFDEGNEYYSYGFAWSDDSSQLAIISLDCTTDCQNELKVVDVATLDSAVYRHEADSRLCGLAWSPDNRLIAFQYSCEVGFSRRVDDVFIWSLESDTWLPVTHRTAPLADAYIESTTTYSMTHNYFWLDNDTLLTASLGGRFWEGNGYYEDSFSFDTSVYQVSANTVETLAPELFAGWEVNPADAATVAYRRETYRLYTNDQSERLWEWASIQFEIAHLEGSRLTPLYTGEGGCNLAWSPDGRYLAYTHPLEEFAFCSGAQASVELVDSRSMTHTSAAVGDEHITPMGWLMVSDE